MRTKGSRIIAYAINEFESVKITLKEEYLGEGCDEDCNLFDKYRYTVQKDNIEEWTDWPGEVELHAYRYVKHAWEKFRELIDSEHDGLGECSIKQVHLCDGFIEDYEDAIDPQPYTRSSTYGDYGPSNPWDAPGMSVSDFIRGVY